MSSVLYRYIITGLPSCRQLEPRLPEAFRFLRVSFRWIDNQGRKVGGSMPELPRVNPKPKPKPNPGFLHGLVQLALYQISAVWRIELGIGTLISGSRRGRISIRKLRLI